MYVYLCIYMFIYVYIFVYIYIHIHVCAYMFFFLVYLLATIGLYVKVLKKTKKLISTLSVYVCSRVSHVSYNQQTLVSQCNVGCTCSLNHWDPVCADDGMTYVSPCLAGCQTSTGAGKDMVRQPPLIFVLNCDVADLDRSQLNLFSFLTLCKNI